MVGGGLGWGVGVGGCHDHTEAEQTRRPLVPPGAPQGHQKAVGRSFEVFLPGARKCATGSYHHESSEVLPLHRTPHLSGGALFCFCRIRNLILSVTTQSPRTVEVARCARSAGYNSHQNIAIHQIISIFSMIKNNRKMHHGLFPIFLFFFFGMISTIRGIGIV